MHVGAGHREQVCVCAYLVPGVDGVKTGFAGGQRRSTGVTSADVTAEGAAFPWAAFVGVAGINVVQLLHRRAEQREGLCHLGLLCGFFRFPVLIVWCPEIYSNY